MEKIKKKTAIPEKVKKKRGASKEEFAERKRKAGAQPENQNCYNRKLTPKQKFFCKEYLIDFNATRAAKKAGYSSKTAFAMGTENLRKPLIIKYLAAETKKRNEKIERNGEEVIARLWEFSDIDRKQYEERNNTKATELLVKHFGLLIEKTENKMSFDESLIGLAIKIAQQRGKGAK